MKGLFIGIDRYASPISRLTCAAADAKAIGALFEDTLPGASVNFLLNEMATNEKILTGLTALADADEDELVVVSFAGHGTADHRLVPVDADVADLSGSCISLDELAAALDKIPGQLLVFLDCCFSGGFGGSRFFAPVMERSAIEDRSSIEALAGGRGRVVVTASGAGEPSLETASGGHGLFSGQLVNALQGPGGGLTERHGWLRLLESVVTGTIEEAKKLGESQTPTIYGSFEGLPSIPRLVMGSRYGEYFPERVRPNVTGNWSSLLGYGFSQSMIDRWAAVIPALNQLQLDAINDFGVLDEKSVLVSAPTGAGKTLIGELAAFRAVSNGSRAVMLLPLKALVNEKYVEFTNKYGDEASIVRATGDHSDQVGELLNGHYDLALLTYEKFLNMALAFPHVLRGVSLVVVDEAQIISDPGRGPALEFLLALLRSGYARGTPIQVVALSAVIGATSGLETWLGAGILRTTERPVPLTESVLDGRGTLHRLEPDGTESTIPDFVVAQPGLGSQSSKPWIIPLVHKLVADGRKVILFRSFKGETVGSSRYLSQALGLPPAQAVLDALPSADVSDASIQLRQHLAGGVGFHNSDLDSDERSLLENEFRDPASNLRVLVATTTLAMGVNTPAEAVIIAGLMHPGPTRYTIAEYKNMAGRAGRPGLATSGESYIIATSDITPDDAWNNYVKATPEDVESHFLSEYTDPKTLILRSLVALGSVQEAGLVALLEGSFAVWQRLHSGLDGWNVEALRRDLESLIASGLLDKEPDGMLTLTELGKYAGESGLEVQSVTNVVSLLRFSPTQICLHDLLILSQVTVELDQQYLPMHKKSHQERNRWPRTLQRMGAAPNLIRNLHVGGGNPSMRAKRAAAVGMFVSSRPMTNIESDLLQHSRGNSCSGPVRASASRTRDVLGAVVQICRITGRSLDDEASSGGLGVRLEIGLPIELAEMADDLGRSLSRGQYLSLFSHGLTSIEQLESQPDVVVDAVGKVAAKRISDRILEVVSTAVSD